MSIDKDTKKELIAKFANTETDTGSPQVQIAVISEKINNLIEHFKIHKHDLHSKKDNEKYMKLIKELNIRG